MAVPSYPLYLTGEQVTGALRNALTTEAAASGVRLLESSKEVPFNPATLHTPGSYIVEYVTGDLPDDAEITHPLMLYISAIEQNSGTDAYIQRMIVGTMEYYRYSYTEGESWTSWNLKSIPGVEELTAEDVEREVYPIFDT